MAKRDVAHTDVAVYSGVLSTRMRQGLWGRLGLTLACVSLATSLSAPFANAQVIKDPRAPITFQPKVRASANGTPLVDITKPSFGGISHNKFQRYDIDTRGVILNNSKLGGTSIIGGKVTANPNLVGSRPARVILNEVTSAAASTLNGPTEVFGSKADVIIANPNGVGCVGCTFINSNRVTLSTGTPLPDYRRGTVSFDVERGKVSIAGQGLSSGGKPLDAVALIGRQIEVKGPVEAKETVRLRAGGMVYNLAGDTAITKNPSQLPAITGPAIRSGAAGRIKAGTVSVISRDVDLGIQLNGKLEALSGEVAIRSSGDLSLAASYAKSDVTLTADGQVTLTGNNQALGRISVSGKRIKVGLNSELAANDAVVLEALQSLATRGVLQAGNTISLVSGGELVAEGTIAANGEVMLEGRSLRTIDLKIGGGAVSVMGLDEARIDNTTIVAGVDSVKVAGRTVELGTGTAFDALNRIVIDAKGDLINGTVLDYGNLDLSVRNTYTNAAGGQLALDHIVLSSSNTIVNAGILYGRISTLIDAGTLSNTETGVIYGKDLTLKIAGDLTNLGQIVSDQTLKIVAGGTVANDNLIQTGGALKVTAAGYRANSAAAVLAGLTADLIVSGALENSGHILGEQRLTASAASLSNRATGAMNAGLSTLSIGGDVLNEGTIGSVTDLSITTQGHLTSPGSLLSSEGNVTLTAAGKVTSGADLIAHGAVTINAAAFDGISASGRVSGANVTIGVSGAFTSKGLVNAENSLSINAGTIKVGPSVPQSDAGTLVGKTIVLTSAGDLVNDGMISATGDAALPDFRITAANVQNNGAIVADDDLSLNAVNYTAAAQGQLGGRTLTVRLGNGVFKNFGLVSGATLVDIQAGRLENGPTVANTHAGLILGETIKLGTLANAIASMNNLGSIEAANDITIYVGNLSNAGSMLAERNGTVTANQVRNDGSMVAGEALTVAAASYAATAQALLSSKVTKLGTDTRHIQIDNAGKILGANSLTVHAGSLMNRGASSVLGGASANVTAHGILTNEGNITGDNALTVTAVGTTTNSGRIIGVEGSLTLNAYGGVTNSGDILARNNLTLTAPWFSNASTSASLGADTVTATIAGALQNYGLVAGTTRLTLSASDILNGPSSGDTIGVISGGAMNLTIGSNLTNQGVLQTTNAGLTLNVPGTLSNTGKISVNGDLALTLPNGFTNAGEVVASSGISYSGPRYVGLTGSALNAFNIDLSVSDFSNAGSLEAVSQLSVTASNIINLAGASIKGYNVDLNGSALQPNTIRNWGTVYGENYLSIYSPAAGGELSNFGTLESANLIDVRALGVLVNSGKILSRGTLSVNTTNSAAGNLDFINQSSGRIQADAVSIDYVRSILNQGHIVGAASVSLYAGDIKNRGASAANYALISAPVVSLDAGRVNNDLNSEIRAEQSATINADTINQAFLTRDTRDTGLFVFGKDLNVFLYGQGYTFTGDLKVKGNLNFQTYGNIINTYVVAAEGNVTLDSWSGSIRNGTSNGSDPGTISAGGTLVLDAYTNILNYGSTILAKGNITLSALEGIINTDVVKADGSVKRALIQSVADGIKGRARTIENRGSTMSAAGGDLFLRASSIKNLTENSQQALMYAADEADISQLTLDTGTIQAGTVIIGGNVVRIGNPNIGNAPPRIPPSSINLTNGFNLAGAGFSQGEGNVYDPASVATNAGVAGKDGQNITASVVAHGQPIATSGPRVIGKVSFLYAVPFDTSADRNPSWIFASVGAGTTNLTFFADPAAERMLIQDALVQQTGRAILDPKYKNPKEQQEEFYQGTVDFLKANAGVKLGDTLSKAQRKKVTKPILWYTWKILRGKRVLVPELILPEKDLKKYAYTPGAGTVLGENVEIKGDKVTNTGTVLATASLNIFAKEFVNERKVIDGKLQTGGVVSAKDLYIETKKDITNRGGTMLAGTSLALNARGNINIETQKIVTTTTVAGGKNWSTASTTKNIGGLVSSGGTLSMSAKKKIEIIGSTVTAKDDINLVGKKGVTVAVAVDTEDFASGGKKSGFFKSSSFSSNLATETNRGSLVSSSKGNVNIRTEKGDLTVAGSHVSAQKNVNLLAGYDADGKRVKGSKASVNIESVQDTVDSSFTQKKSGVGLFFGDGGFDIYRKTSMAGTTSIGTNIASSISSKDGNVNVKAARDVNIEGSAVTAKRQILIDAKRDVNIDPGQHEAAQTFTRKVSGIGVHVSGGDGGFGIQAGYHGSSMSNGQAATRVARSILSGDEGISIHAGRDSTIVAATIASRKGQVKIDAGRDNKILAGTDTDRSYQTNKEVFAGIKLQVSQNVSGALRQIAQTPELARSGYGNPAFKAIGTMSAALNLTQGALSLSNPTISATLTVGASGSKTQSVAWSNTAVGTTIKGNALVLTAGRDVHLQGVQAKIATDIAIDAKRHVTMESAQSTAGSSSSSSSWNVGVGLGGSCSAASGCSGGIYLEGGASQAKAHDWSVTQLNTHLNAGGNVHLGSGRNTTLAGAVVKGATIDVDVKGNLTLASRQDTAHGSSSSSNIGGSLTIGLVGPSSVSVSGGGSRSTSDLAWVSEQTGLFADGTLTATVGKHTQINGAVLNSATGQLTLDTGTLGFKDLRDHDRGSSVSGQVGLGIGTQPNGAGQPGEPSGTVSGSYASYDREQTTRATIGEGTIVVRDKDKQKQDVAALNRDVDQAQVITKNEREGVSVYVSDSSVREAIKAVEFVGKSLSQISTGVFSKLGQGGNKTFQDLADAKQQGKLTDEDIVTQLSQCQSHTFNLFNIFVSPAHAAETCGVKTSDGRYIPFSPADKERCVDTYVQILGKSLEYELNGKERSELVCLDCGPGGTRVTYPAFSGQGDAINDPTRVNVPFVGAVPPGAYYLVARESGGTLGWLKDAFRSLGGNDKNNWFTLVSAETLSGRVPVGDVTRDSIRLHPGSVSEGCITLCYMADFTQLRQQLLGGQPNFAPGSDKQVFGTIIVYPAQKSTNGRD
ncbi:hemagglutinin repeat-containing protein [Microvirga thermotolerans]|nr:hemagglutinin repeat-containing protein [Microvirga thermotolerans]